MPESTQQPRQIRKRVGRNVFDAPPRVSVIITAYNKAQYIKETVDSVLAQKYREHEIIVVNDGSDDTDYLERELKVRMEDIIYIRQRHAGEGAARNTGIVNARGSIVAFLNAGDLWQPDLLASQNVHLERNGLDLVYCDAAIFGTKSVYRRNFMDRFPSAGEVSCMSLLERRCHVLMSGTVARKSHIVDAGMFADKNAPKPALHLWLRMAKAGARIGFQSKQLVKLRTERDGAEPDALARVENERNVYEHIRRTIELNAEETDIVCRRIAELEAELAAEQGHSFLKSGDYTEAIMAFRVANRHQHSLKLTAMTWLTRVAPKTAMRFSAANHPTGPIYTSSRI